MSAILLYPPPHRQNSVKKLRKRPTFEILCLISTALNCLFVIYVNFLAKVILKKSDLSIVLKLSLFKGVSVLNRHDYSSFYLNVRNFRGNPLSSFLFWHTSVDNKRNIYSDCFTGIFPAVIFWNRKNEQPLEWLNLLEILFFFIWFLITLNVFNANNWTHKNVTLIVTRCGKKNVIVIK